MKGENGLWTFDGTAHASIINTLDEAACSWYAGGLKLHPAIFSLPVGKWIQATVEAQEPAYKQRVVGLQEVLTPEEGKRNALVLVGPIVGAWLLFADPVLREVEVRNKDYSLIGAIKVWE